MNKHIRVEHGEIGLATVIIDRAEALNSLNREILLSFKTTLEELSKDPKVRVIILRGAGDKSFIAGADIKEMQPLDRSDAAYFSRLGHQVCMLLEHMPKVTIAAVQGFALGGGLEFALACDFILASENAEFGMPEVSLGVIPGFGGTIRLARAVGTAKAKELIFAGIRFQAKEAKDLGLIRHVYPQANFFEAVKETATKISKNSLAAIITAKKLMNEFEENVGTHPKVDAEIHQFASLFGTKDQIEGMTAFSEKREAKFKGL
jgi:enoyl-CoA hydratase